MSTQLMFLDPIEPAPTAEEPAKPLRRNLHEPPRLRRPARDQVEATVAALDDLLPDDHRARLVWQFVQGLDLSSLYDQIAARGQVAGAPAIDPQLLMALWLYATVDGIGSARHLRRACQYDLPYRWLCGGVNVNYHTLSDFRSDNGELLDELLTQSVAVMMAEGLVSIERVAVDGMRVRANAGASSFRRRPTLQEALVEAREHVEQLERELHEDPGACSRRQAAARRRAAREREERVASALDQLKQIEDKKKKDAKDKARASTTDAEARVMKMGDGGFRPAYNVELATDTESGVIVGVSVVNTTDMGQLAPTVEQLTERYGHSPQQVLADGGFAKKEDITRLSEAPFNCEVYAPVQVSKSEKRPAHEPHESDTAAVARWRERMASEEAKVIYRERAATAEWSNARFRGQGLIQMLVRGIRKTTAVGLWHALAHNMMRYYALRSKCAPATT